MVDLQDAKVLESTMWAFSEEFQKKVRAVENTRVRNFYFGIKGEGVFFSRFFFPRENEKKKIASPGILILL